MIERRIEDDTLNRHVGEHLAALGITDDDGSDRPAAIVVDPAALRRGSIDPDGPPVVLVAHASDAATWQLAAEHRIDHLVALPEAGLLLRRHLRRLAARPGAGTVVRVIGVRGGCGATTLAVGLARTLAADRRVVLVDADAAGPGLDHALGLTKVSGTRWPDLVELRGPLPGSTLRSRLPRADGVAVLTHPAAAVADSRAAWPATIASLRTGFDAVVIDLPMHQVPDRPGPGRDVLLTPADVGGLVCARRVAADHGGAVVAVRPGRGPLDPAAMADALPGSDVVTIPDSRSVPGAADFGELLEAVGRGGYARACRRLAERLAGAGRAR